MRRYKGNCEIFFFGDRAHRLRNEEKEEQFNREAKEGWRFAADAARKTDERASSEDRKHTSGGVLVAVDSNLGSVVGVEDGAIDSIPGNECRIAQAWVNVRGGLRVFSVYFWHSEGSTPLLEAVLKQARTTRHPWFLACDANTCLEDFEKCLWFQRDLLWGVCWTVVPERVKKATLHSKKGDVAGEVHRGGQERSGKDR